MILFHCIDGEYNNLWTVNDMENIWLFIKDYDPAI